MVTNTLIVYRERQRIGTLENRGDGYVFTYDADFFKSNPPHGLSVALPLQAESFTPQQSRAFFANLLPEGSARDHVAAMHRVSPENDFDLLKLLGGECAGAISLFEEGQLPTASAYSEADYRVLDDASLSRLLDQPWIMDMQPFEEGAKIRLSLAGAQDKLPVRYNGNTIMLPLNGAPSTHIIKPQSLHLRSLVENETFCMTLASAIGFDIPPVQIIDHEDERFYMIDRYDRRILESGIILRLHQEDFCQALGVSPRIKYEEQGGPGFSDCFRLVKSFSNPLSDLRRLLDLTIFNVLIGNCDCHAKNLSLLYHNNSAPSLAPFYDLVCTQMYVVTNNLTTSMAMKIGGVDKAQNLSVEALEQFVQDVGIRSANLVYDRIRHVVDKVDSVIGTVQQNMIDRYGNNDIYKEIFDYIDDRGRALSRLSKQRPPNFTNDLKVK